MVDTTVATDVQTGDRLEQPAPASRPKARRNPGMPLDLGWVQSARVNRSAVERRAATLVTRRTVKKEWQAAWLLRAIADMDLTSLAGDDTPGNIRRLCAKGRNPLRADMAEALGVTDLRVAAICVYHTLVPTAVEALQGSGIPVAAVSTGFPAGQISLSEKLAEITSSIEAGATEIDIVISRAYVLDAKWRSLYEEVRAFREACGTTTMKAIVATGDLATLRNAGQASLVCMMAGADFIKTSTGKETTNATLPVGEVMVRAIREYYDRTAGEYRVGFKPAGGIRTAKQAIQWLILMKEELGTPWMMPDLFRIGASSLLTDIERQLSHFLSGHYAAEHHFPMP